MMLSILMMLRHHSLDLARQYHYKNRIVCDIDSVEKIKALCSLIDRRLSL